MRKSGARKIMVGAIECAIRRELESYCSYCDSPNEDGERLEEARLKIMGWTSPRLMRLAAKAAVAVLEAGLEGERLRDNEGDA